MFKKFFNKLFGRNYKWFECLMYHKNDDETIDAIRFMMRADNTLKYVLSNKKPKYDELSQYTAIKEELDVMCKVAKCNTHCDWKYIIFNDTNTDYDWNGVNFVHFVPSDYFRVIDLGKLD